jgi:hypothetical protein
MKINEHLMFILQILGSAGSYTGLTRGKESLFFEGFLKFVNW